MKILTHNQFKEADAYTIANEPIASIDLMERAAQRLTEAIISRWDRSHRMVVFAGPGNNGGDALAVARMLFLKNYDVEVFLFNVTGTLSEECVANIQRLKEVGFGKHNEISNQFTPPQLSAQDVVIDGLFGVGLNKALSGGFAAVVKYINASPSKVVSIDVPSGLMCEDNTHNIRQNIIRATLTLTIQYPKLAFFFAENEEIIGEVEVIDIQLKDDYLKQADTPYFITEGREMRSIIKPRKRFAHKGNFGHALLIAGSYGMAGAAILSAKACLKSGVGLLTVHSPIKNIPLLQTAVPEAIVQSDLHEEFFVEPTDLDNFQAVGIGPGIGQEEDTALAMLDQVKTCYLPLVLDADALNNFSTHRTWLNRIPKRSILTPHVKELERIIGKCTDSFERLTKAKELASYLQCFIIIKGAWSIVVTPEGNCYINPTGNPGMATAGSGDVLTGIITSLLAQGYGREDACRLAVYVHGMAGDIAAERMGEISMTAQDIIDALPEAWKKLSETKN